MRLRTADEFATYCWNRAGSAVIVAMIFYVIFVKFMLSLIVRTYEEVTSAHDIAPMLTFIRDSGNMLDLSFLVFYLAFYWSRFRGMKL